MYEVQYRKRAIKALAKINAPYYTAILKASITLLMIHVQKGAKKLTGRDGYPIRVAYYRIIYDIYETHLIIEIVNIGNRGDIYQD